MKRGLKFTPTPLIDHQELKEDIHKFCRRLILVEYFADKDGEDGESLVRNKSTFIPNSGRNKPLDDYMDSLLNYPFVSN